MATSAHCFYCFECLYASFEGREPPSLEKVEDLWDQYELSRRSGQQVKPSVLEAIVPRLDKIEDLDAQNEDEVEEGGEGEEHDSEDEIVKPIQSARPQHQSVSRLQAPTPESQSSNSSSPSVISAKSSDSALTNASSTSTASTRPSYASRLSVTDSYPLFVTWNTVSRSSGDKRLRGCIGTFEPLPLENGLQSYALTSAFDDTRFSPIPASLMSALSCSLTLLADFEPSHDAMDWVLGQHGIRISFTHRGRRLGATYLPDVAVEQGWNKEETLESLMRKAGWDGSSQGGGYARRILRGGSRAEDHAKGRPWEQVADFKTIRYTGLRSNADYAEWKEWRDWVDKSHGAALR